MQTQYVVSFYEQGGDPDEPIAQFTFDHTTQSVIPAMVHREGDRISLFIEDSDRIDWVGRTLEGIYRIVEPPIAGYMAIYREHGYQSIEMIYTVAREEE